MLVNNISITTHSNKKYTIECDDSDNILQAGLREGLNLKYECSNGTCGVCSAVLKSGEIKKISHHDYKIPQNKLDENAFLMCCNAAVSDIKIYTQLQNETKHIAIQNISAKVKNIEFLTNTDIAILTLRMSRAKNLQYIAGQEAILTFNGVKSIDYPIASCPCFRIELEFHIRKNNKDAFAKLLFTKKIKAKTKINITGPKGIFRLNENCELDITFIAWDIGFAPIRSVIEHNYDLDLGKKTKFYWAYPKNEQKPYLHKYAKSWCEIFDDYNYSFIACDFNSENDYFLIAKNIFASINLDFVITSNVYLAAPAGIVIYLRKLLLQAGLDKDKIIAFPV